MINVLEQTKPLTTRKTFYLPLWLTRLLEDRANNENRSASNCLTEILKKELGGGQ